MFVNLTFRWLLKQTLSQRLDCLTFKGFCWVTSSLVMIDWEQHPEKTARSERRLMLSILYYPIYYRCSCTDITQYRPFFFDAMSLISRYTLEGHHFLRVTREAPNPNLQVAITHARHVCNQQRLGFHWNAQNAIWSRVFGPFVTRILITRVLTIHHVKVTQSTGIKQTHFYLRSLSPAIPNFRLLLVSLR